MPARVDSGESYRDIVERVFSEEFMGQLAKRFDFDLDLDRLNVRRELRGIASAYIVGARDDGGKSAKEQQNRYRQLRSAVTRFANLVKEFEDNDIATDLRRFAIWKKEDSPHSDEVIAGQRTRKQSDFLYRHFLNLLELLDEAARHRINFYKAPRGRPRNLALQGVIMKVEQFWTFDLHRKFSVDYHKGAGLTEAFEFIRALIDPLDDVTDQQIITAMREEIRNQRSGRIKPKSPKQPFTK